MTSDRRNFLKSGLGGLAGLTALPLLGSLAGCQQLPTRSGSAKALSTAKVSDRISVITDAPGNVIVLSSGDGVVLVDSGSAALAPAVFLWPSVSIQVVCVQVVRSPTRPVS